MLNCGPCAVVVAAEREELVAVAVHRSPAAGEVLLDQMERKRVVAGRHRRVRREDGRAPHFGERVFPGLARREEVAHALQHDERRVAFVQVPHGRLQAERAQREHAAEAEHDFLLQARVLAAAVQPRGQLAIPRLVLLEVRVEQQQAHAPELHFPHLHEHAFACRAARARRTAVRRRVCARRDRRVASSRCCS